MDDRPIGVFDSGLGGLTVVKEINRLLPNENIVYLGDTARIPYGTRSRETITRFVWEDATYLLTQNVKCLVIACNTASALASDWLKRKIKLPIFDVVKPAAKSAVAETKLKKIGLIGTRGTVSSQAYEKAIQRASPNIRVVSQACPLLVPFIEEGEIKGKLIEALVAKYLARFNKSQVDVLILGCTHYPIIAGLISRQVGKKITLVNPETAVVKDIIAYLKKKEMLAPFNQRPEFKYFVTDLTERFTRVAEMFLGERLKGSLKKVILS